MRRPGVEVSTNRRRRLLCDSAIRTDRRRGIFLQNEQALLTKMGKRSFWHTDGNCVEIFTGYFAALLKIEAK
jgi:hypothetical protein